MPVIRKNKAKTESNDTQAIKSLFKKYNEDKVTVKGIFKFVEALFYRLGYIAELAMLLLGKKIRKYVYLVYRKAKRILKEVLIFTERLLKGVLEDIGFSQQRVDDILLNIKNIWAKSKKENRKGTQDVGAYVAQGVKRTKSSGQPL